MLQIKNLHASIGDKEILKGINLEVKAGEVHAIMGPNGSGNSTLSSIIAVIENYEVTDGEIFLDGEVLADLAPRRKSASRRILVVSISSRNPRCFGD